MMSRWAVEEYTPCREPLPISLSFLSPKHTRPAISQHLHRLWRQMGDAASCFGGGMDVLSANLPDSVARQHIDGSCAQFDAAFVVLSGRARYFFLMEPDMLPIRPHWLVNLMHETPARDSPASSFWVRGSLSQCTGEYAAITKRHDWHINGNALYRLDDPGFESFRARVRTFFPAYMARGVSYPACATGQMYEEGYDHARYQFMRHPRNSDYARSIAHRFQYTSGWLNLCEEVYDEAAIRAARPDVFIVHSKAPFFNANQTLLRKISWDTIGEFQDKKFVLPKLVAKLRAGTLTPAEYQKRLCATRHYGVRVKAGLPHEACTQICLQDAQLRRANSHMMCASAGERMRWQREVPPGVPYVWTNDFHVSPAACYAPILRDLGAKLHAEIDFANWRRTWQSNSGPPHGPRVWQRG